MGTVHCEICGWVNLGLCEHEPLPMDDPEADGPSWPHHRLSRDIYEFLESHAMVSMDEVGFQFQLSTEELEQLIFEEGQALFMDYFPIYCSMCQRKVLSSRQTRNQIFCIHCRELFKKQIEIEKNTESPCKGEDGGELSHCVLCGKDYLKRRSNFCIHCQATCKDVYRYIQKHPGASLESISKKFSLRKALLNTIMIYGDVGTACDLVASCLVCSTDLTPLNRRGKVCQKCYTNINSTKQESQSAQQANLKQTEKSGSSLREKQQYGMKRRM